jgi:hypothetical protein
VTFAAAGSPPPGYVPVSGTSSDQVGAPSQIAEAGSTPPNSNWTPPQEAIEKIPPDWGPSVPNKRGSGIRWFDPSGPEVGGIRIDPGNPNSQFASQQTDHVVVRSGGKIIGRDGRPISGRIADDPSNAHIPLDVWLRWKYWNKP